MHLNLQVFQIGLSVDYTKFILITYLRPLACLHNSYFMYSL
jgi:hypothetical protein